jgi:hypothetical protein
MLAHPLALALAALLVGFSLGVLFHRTATTRAAEPSGGAPAAAGGAGSEDWSEAGGESPYSGGDPWASFDPPSTPEPGSGSGGGDRSATSPLLDPQNLYTVVCITYGKGRDRELQAQAVVRHLREAGLPAQDPIRREQEIVVVVGAAPTASDLGALAARVRSQIDPSGAYGFGDAYVQRIDQLIRR